MPCRTSQVPPQHVRGIERRSVPQTEPRGVIILLLSLAVPGAQEGLTAWGLGGIFISRS
jgi:hypothetical protein